MTPMNFLQLLMCGLISSLAIPANGSESKHDEGYLYILVDPHSRPNIYGVFATPRMVDTPVQGTTMATDLAFRWSGIADPILLTFGNLTSSAPPDFSTPVKPQQIVGDKLEVDALFALEELFHSMPKDWKNVRLIPKLSFAVHDQVRSSYGLATSVPLRVVSVESGKPVTASEWLEFTARCSSALSRSLGEGIEPLSEAVHVVDFWRRRIPDVIAPSYVLALCNYEPERGVVIYSWKNIPEHAANGTPATILIDLLTPKTGIVGIIQKNTGSER